MQEKTRIDENARSPLSAAAGILVLCGVAYRLMFSASVAGFFGNALADMIFFSAVAGLLLASVRRGAVRFNATAAWAALALFFIASLITAKTAANPRAAVGPLADLAALACLFLAASGAVYGESGAPRAAAYLVSLTAIAISVAFYQYFFEFPLILSEGVKLPGWVGGVYIDEKNAADFRTRIETMRAFATFLTPNVLAGVLALVLPMTISLGVAAFLAPGRPSAKVLPVAATAVMSALEAALLLVTKSKAGIAAAALGVGLFLLLMLRRLFGRKAFIAVIVAGALLLGGAIVVDFPRARQYYEEANKSLEVRIGYWQTTWGLIKAQPVSGVGAGNFGEAYVTFKEIGIREVQDPHNWFLKAWAEGGLFALLFFTAFWVLVFAGKRDAADVRAGPGAPASALAIVGGLLIYFVTQADFSSVNLGLTATVVAGAAAAIVLVIILVPASSLFDLSLIRAGLAAGVAGFLVHGLTDVDLSDAGAATAAVFAAGALAPRGLKTSVPSKVTHAAFLALLACAGLILFVWRVLVPLSQAQFAMDAAVQSLERGQVQVSADLAADAMRLDPADPYIPAFIGRLYAASPSARVPGDPHFSSAEALFERSLLLDRRYRPAHEGLARLYAAAGPGLRDKAIEQQRILLLLYPNNSYYCVAAGRLLEQAGRLKQARDSYRLALEINDWTEEHGRQFTSEERIGLRADVARLNAIVGRD